MANGIISRFKRAVNVFRNKDPSSDYQGYGPAYYYRPDRPRLTRGNEHSITTAIYNRIATDAASVGLFHVRLDENGRYKDTMNSTLNSCFTLEANIDQTGRAFIEDIVLSMCDEGVVAIVKEYVDPLTNDILSLRTGKIVTWFPDRVRVRAYNDQTGNYDEVTLPKSEVAIIENPFYAIMNEPSSTMQRLIRKLNLADVVDEQSGSKKLDLIIQLPYSTRSDIKKRDAERRLEEIENQLIGSEYGIAYIDGVEHITQLNRAVENNLQSRIEYLTSMLYGQLGITQKILDGSAEEQEMLNYQTRLLEPILSAIADEIKRKFLTKTARTQGQSIMFFRDPFKLVPVNSIAEIADKMTRNEIMTSNELRTAIGMKPSDDPSADELRNKNLNQSSAEKAAGAEIQNETENTPIDEGPDSGGLNEMSHEEQLDALVEQLLGSLETEIDGIVGDYLAGGDDG